MISDGVIGTTELADDAITPVKLDETGNYTIAQLDVNGTLTSDGLTVDGQTVISSSSFDPLYLRRTSTASTTLVMENSDNDGGALQADSNGLRLYTRTSSSFDERIRLASNGDISFYDTSGNAKFFWDASAESLGIGVTSVNTQGDLYIGGTGNSDDVLIGLSPTNSTGGQNPLSQIGASADGTYGSTLYFNTRSTGGTVAERMTIKSDGKIGIGITDPTASWSDGVGVQFNPVGEVLANKGNSISLYLNRASSSGSARHALAIYEDTSAMGYLGMGSGSEFAIVTPSSYVSQKINNETDGIQYSSAGTYHLGPWLSKHNSIDLGRDNGRWRDAYLGGNVYIGGGGTDSDHRLQIGEYNTNSANQSEGETKLIHVDDSYVMRVARRHGSGNIASTGWYNVAKIPPFGTHGKVTVSLGGDFTADVIVVEWISSHNTGLNNSLAAPQVTAKATFAHTTTPRVTNTRVARDATTGTYYVQVYVSSGVNNNTNGKSVLEVHLGEYLETNNSNIEAMFSLYTGGVSHYFECPIITNGSNRLGRHTTPEQPFFMASMSSNLVIGRTPGYYTFPFNQTRHNIGGHFNTSTYTFTAPVSGFYEFAVNIETNSNSVWDTNTWIYTGSLFKNGSAVVGNDNWGDTGKHNTWSYTFIDYFAAGDAAQVQGYNTGNYIDYSGDSGSSTSVGNCRFSGRLLT
jgi:hypothetical protein